MRVGFIGLGNMGAPMAANILAAGHDLIVHDVQPGRARALEREGAEGAASPPMSGNGATR